MPRQVLPPRLYLDKKRKTWVIRFHNMFKRLPYSEDDWWKAQKYLNELCRSGKLDIQAKTLSHTDPAILQISKDVGRIYFISRAGSLDDPIKIGFSQNSPRLRLGSLQTGNPVDLEIITSSSGCIITERIIHIILDAFRLRGEWFSRHPLVVSAVEAAKNGALIAWIEANSGIAKPPQLRHRMTDGDDHKPLLALVPTSQALPLLAMGLSLPA